MSIKNWSKEDVSREASRQEAMRKWDLEYDANLGVYEHPNTAVSEPIDIVAEGRSFASWLRGWVFRAGEVFVVTPASPQCVDALCDEVERLQARGVEADKLIIDLRDTWDCEVRPFTLSNARRIIGVRLEKYQTGEPNEQS